mmetsp:Transcript_24935/g.57425  ORF Transcript_24935/g.57425 Transcript_24935/m.57425 type:complete len:207 (-) Transcript_24935:163-783(-)
MLRFEEGMVGVLVRRQRHTVVIMVHATGGVLGWRHLIRVHNGTVGECHKHAHKPCCGRIYCSMINAKLVWIQSVQHPHGNIRRLPLDEICVPGSCLTFELSQRPPCAHVSTISNVLLIARNFCLVETHDNIMGIDFLPIVEMEQSTRIADHSARLVRAHGSRRNRVLERRRKLLLHVTHHSSLPLREIHLSFPSQLLLKNLHFGVQ